MSGQGEWAAPGAPGPDGADHVGTPAAEAGGPRWLTWVVDDGYGARVTTVALRLQWKLFALLVLLGGVAGASYGLGDPGPFLTGIAIGAVVAALLAVVTVYRGRRRIRRVLPSGSVLAACLMPDEVWFSGPSGSSQVPYRVFGSVRVSRDLVMLRRRGAAWMIYPLELFGIEGVVWLRQRIAAGQGPATPGAARP